MPLRRDDNGVEGCCVSGRPLTGRSNGICCMAQLHVWASHEACGQCENTTGWPIVIHTLTNYQNWTVQLKPNNHSVMRATWGNFGGRCALAFLVALPPHCCFADERRFASLSAQWMPGSSAKGSGNWMVPAGNACTNGERVQLYLCWQCALDAWMTCVRGWWQWISINFIFIKSRQSCVKSSLPSQQSVVNVVLHTPTQKLWQYLRFISAPNIPYLWAVVYD